MTGDLVPLDVRRCGLRAKASVNGTGPRWFRVDTGCASPVQWVTRNVKPQVSTTRVAVGLARVGITQTRTTVKIGRQLFTDVETGLHSSGMFDGEAGLLGNGLLTRFRWVSLDAVHGEILFGARR